MNIRHIQLIMKREYLQRLRTPAFIIGTVLVALSIAALSFLPALLNMLGKEDPSKIAIVDPKNLIYSYLPQGADSPSSTAGDGLSQGQQATLSSGFKWSKASTSDSDVLSQKVTSGEISAYVVVEGATLQDIHFVYHGKDRPSQSSSASLLSLLQAASVQARLTASGITPQQAQALFAAPELKVEPIAGGSIRDEKAYFQSASLVYVLLILLYMTMLLYGVQVAMGVVEEKSSRVMEILITAVRPIELMIGKVLGIGLVGLTQYGIWVGIGLLVLAVSGILSRGSASFGVDVASVPATTLIFFLIFFVLGYLLYASLYAALASLVNRTEEVNSVTTPITIVMVGTYLLSFYGLANPEADLIRWLSFVPFFTPMLMFIRVALSNPSWWELLISVVLLMGASLFFSWVAAKIYRVGVLLYGKRPSFREIGRLLRSA